MPLTPSPLASLVATVRCYDPLSKMSWSFLVVWAVCWLSIASSLSAAEPKSSWEEVLDKAHLQKDLSRVQAVLDEQAAANQRNSAWWTQRARLEFEKARLNPVRSSAYKQHFANALKYAKDATVLNPSSGRAHAWYAYILGAQIENADPETQIRNSFEIRTHLERGINLGERTADSYFALGRWHYGLADLGWVTRKMAASLYAEPPVGSFVEAARNLQKAIDVEPQKLSAYLWLARTKLKLDDEAGARKILEQALQVKNPLDDQNALVEIKKLLKSL
ncbi:MAG: tetratricopeptide repeat protein [Myxococcota bacterium]